MLTHVFRRVVPYMGSLLLGPLRRLRLWGGTARFCVWWFGLFAAMGSFSTCPCCGQQGCGVGMAGAGLMGGLAAGVIALARRITGFSRARFDTNHGHGRHAAQSED